MIKYSIVLPVRNGGEYVKECVNSILSQSYSNFTLHILDNNSVDGTFEWLSSLSDPRIEIYKSTIDLSIEDNWARILEVQKNEYMTLIGHDDILYTDYLLVMNNLIEKNKDASLYLSHFHYIDSKGKILRCSKPMHNINTPIDFLKTILDSKIDITGTGFVMRSADYNTLGGIPAYPNLLFADFELWIKLVNISYIAISNEISFAFRLHSSTSSSSPDFIMLDAFNKFVQFLVSLSKTSLDLTKIIISHAPQFLYFHCKGLSHRLIRTSFNKRRDLTVYKVILKFNDCAKYIGVEFYPFRKPTLLIALFIDSNFITRKAFLIFKYFFRTPVFK